MTQAFLGLGSNLGAREKYLQEALSSLADEHLLVTGVSRVYETEPAGLRDQPWFLNQVAAIRTSLDPFQLLERCLGIEAKLGRERSIVNGPRTIDIDVLFYGDLVISTPELSVPHPRYRDRRFVLAPLAEITPDLVDPVTGQTVRAMLAKLEGQPVSLW